MNTLLLLTVLALAATAAVWHGLYLRPDGPLGLALRRLAVDDRGEAGTTDTSDNHDDDGGDQADAQGDDPADGDSGGEDALGDAGKKALDAMKAERNAARREARDLKRRIADLEAKASDGKDETDPDAIKAEARRQALVEANERILRSEVKAAAAGKFADPGDALRLLDLSEFEVDEDGTIDEEQIADAIDALLTAKPYLSAQGGKRFQGTGDGGPRNGGRPAQLTRADLADMSPDQIVQAKADGRLDHLLGIK